jgi:hypothetical protein
MRILFDQGTPVPIAKFLAGHSVRTAFQEGWDRLSNGDLLRAAEEAGFDVLLTTDNSIVYQQNLSNRKIAIVVLSRNRWRMVQRMIPQILAAVDAATPGSYTCVDIPLKMGSRRVIVCVRRLSIDLPARWSHDRPDSYAASSNRTTIRLPSAASAA